MVRIALGLEYDGSSFCGWQSQPECCGVQDALERALHAIAGEPVRVVAAGRTDTGVHALMQVVHFDTAANRPETAWVRGVNSHLPSGVAVRWAHAVNEAFSARYSAQERCYRYILLNRPVRPALGHGRVGWFHSPLDFSAMREAADFLLGEHDFSAFRAAECQAKSPVRTIRRLDIAQQEESFIIDICADAFLHHMVRNIVGCLVYVGKGRHEPQWLERVLASRDRKLAAPTFPPGGLYLAQVRYAAHWGLPEMPATDSAAYPGL